MKGLILAGGHGTHLRPLTHTGPKQLIPLANKPNILYCLEDLRDAGITDVGVILGDIMPEKVQELLGNGASYGVRITYIVQGPPKGIAHAIGCAEAFMEKEPFCVYLGDNVLRGGIKSMVDDFNTQRYDAGILLCRVRNPDKFGIAELDAKGNVIGLEEKPKQPKSDLALVGIYLMRDSVFPIIRALRPSWRNEFEITEALDDLRKRGGTVKAHVVTGWWKDTGRPEDILEANRFLLDDLKGGNEGTLEEGSRVEGRVKVGAGTVIKAGSVIRGPTVIGNNCIIGPNTHIGPYTSVGDGSRLVGADVEDSILMGDCMIETPNRIINSLIGRYVTIRSASNHLPRGQKLIVGENSSLVL
ncbi:MAG TPA: glucose-1-phosphate thymidylyltransferase [Thermoplasmata archaeon]|nr:glucose-1-phosphate thymidylyltransferase [Thermoplasmata archaeon]